MSEHSIGCDKLVNINCCPRAGDSHGVMKKSKAGKLSKSIMAICCVGIVIASIGARAAMSDSDSAGEVFERYRDTVGEVARLADEESRPFLFARERARGRYMPSIERFPSVRSCLIRIERSAETPNLAAFDWDEIDSNEDAEVCIFRVASSYGSPEDMHQWLLSQGFISQVGRPAGREWFGIGATWPIKDQGVKFSANILDRILANWFAYALSISIRYNEDNSVAGLSVGLTYQ